MMINFLRYFSLGAYLLLSVMASPVSGLAKTTASLNGFVINIHAGRSRNEVHALLKEVKAMGAKTVSLKVAEFQKNSNSDIIRPEPTRTAPFLLVRDSIRLARKEQLDVILMPILLLLRPRFYREWRGALAPKDFKRWANHYQYTILKYARLAQEEEAFALIIGSELSSLEKRNAFWKTLIKETRKIFKGKLIYAFNWDHLSKLKAWKDLDYLGLSIYFGFKPDKEAPLKSLHKQWQPHIKTITAWAKKIGRPILITEVGYPSHDLGLQRPWDHEYPAKGANEAVQALGFKALLNAWAGQKQLAGIQIYHWENPKVPIDVGYTPKGKLAEKTLRKWLNVTP